MRIIDTKGTVLYVGSWPLPEAHGLPEYQGALVELTAHDMALIVSAWSSSRLDRYCEFTGLFHILCSNDPRAAEYQRDFKTHPVIGESLPIGPTIDQMVKQGLLPEPPPKRTEVWPQHFGRVLRPGNGPIAKVIDFDRTLPYSEMIKRGQRYTIKSIRKCRLIERAGWWLVGGAMILGAIAAVTL